MLGQNCVVEEPSQQAPDQRRHPEQPQLADSPEIASSRHHDRRASGARRVYRGVSDGDADQVDQREAEADGQRRESLGRALVR